MSNRAMPYFRQPIRAPFAALEAIRHAGTRSAHIRLLLRHIDAQEEEISSLHLIHAAERAGETVTWPASHQVLVGGGEG